MSKFARSECSKFLLNFDPLASVVRDGSINEVKSQMINLLYERYQGKDQAKEENNHKEKISIEQTRPGFTNCRRQDPRKSTEREDVQTGTEKSPCRYKNPDGFLLLMAAQRQR